MLDRFGSAQLRPEELTGRLAALHRRIQRDHRAQRIARERALRRHDVDETGRTWPGLVPDQQPTAPPTRSRTR